MSLSAALCPLLGERVKAKILLKSRTRSGQGAMTAPPRAIARVIAAITGQCCSGLLRRRARSRRRAGSQRGYHPDRSGRD